MDTEFGFKSEGEQKISGPDRDKAEYMFLKILYSKAKFLRKTRQLQECDETCTQIIDYVKGQSKLDDEEKKVSETVED